jgi:anti-sigma B factor antagonist
MVGQEQSIYLVDATAEPVAILIHGKASYLNCAPISEFLAKTLFEGKRNYLFDMAECTGMDSTFLGIIAGLALDVKKMNPKGNVILCHLSPRNTELVQNLGLHRLLELKESFPNPPTTSISLAPILGKCTSVSPQTILKAHENLIQADSSNLKKFQDVITYLKANSPNG